MIETMTVRELVTDLRARGVKTSETMERANIVHGIYPFAHGIDTGKSTSCRIYTKMYRDWLRERGLEMKWVKEKMEEKMDWTRKDTEETLWLIPFGAIIGFLVGAIIS